MAESEKATRVLSQHLKETVPIRHHQRYEKRPLRAHHLDLAVSTSLSFYSQEQSPLLPTNAVFVRYISEPLTCAAHGKEEPASPVLWRWRRRREGEGATTTSCPCSPSYCPQSQQARFFDENVGVKDKEVGTFIPEWHWLLTLTKSPQTSQGM